MTVSHPTVWQQQEYPHFSIPSIIHIRGDVQYLQLRCHQQVFSSQISFDLSIPVLCCCVYNCYLGMFTWITNDSSSLIPLSFRKILVSMCNVVCSRRFCHVTLLMTGIFLCSTVFCVILLSRYDSYSLHFHYLQDAFLLSLHNLSAQCFIVML